MITAVDYFNYHFQRNKGITVLYLKWPFVLFDQILQS